MILRGPKAHVDSSGAATAAGGFANTGIIHGDVTTVVGLPVRSAYLQQVRRIAPEMLQGRDQELAVLAELCHRSGGAPYLWLRAPAWAGKSALLSWFVLHPPPKVRVVSFFITARFAGQNDRVAFVDVLLEQLAELLGATMPAHLTEATREAHLLDMLTSAAELCRRKGERLVLVVDGLDEDRGVTVGPDAYSIAASLPAKPPEGMRLVVAGRPDPPIPADVAADHPLRDLSIVRDIASSPYAEVVRSDAQRELRQLLYGSLTEQDLLGLVTAAGGGLTGADLAELTGLTEWEIEEHLQAVSGRTFARRIARWSPAAPIYVLAHEELQQESARYLGSARISVYRHRLQDWAAGYRRQGWPAKTPEYLLHGYYNLLRAAGDVSAMIDLASDRCRQDRMVAATGGDSAALAEITAAQDDIAAEDRPDLKILGQLAVHRAALMARNTRIPANLPVVWALLGDHARGEALAFSIARHEDQVQALADIAEIVAAAGNQIQANFLTTRAEDIARSIVGSNEKGEALITAARSIAKTGDPDRAVALVEETLTIPRPYLDELEEAWRLGEIAEVAAAAGNIDRAKTIASSITQARVQAETLAGISLAVASMRPSEALALADRAEAVAATIPDPLTQATALAHLGKTAAAIGNPDRAQALLERAEVITRSQPESLDYFYALAAIARAAAAISELDRAEAAVESMITPATQERITDPGTVVDVLGDIVCAAVNVGDMERAYALVDRVENMIHSYSEPGQWTTAGFEIEVLSIIARALGEAGAIDRARALAERAEAVARSSAHLPHQLSALIAIAPATFDAGNPTQARVLAQRAEDIARSIIDTYQRTRQLASVARVTAAIGDIDRAEAIADSLADPFEQVWALADIARTAYECGDPDHGCTLARQALAIARAAIGPETQGRALGNLAFTMAAIGDVDSAETAADSIIDPFQRAWAQAEVAREIASAGKPDRALALIHRAEATAQTLESTYHRAQVLGEVARAVAESGAMDRAETIADSIGEPIERARALADVAWKYASIGKPDRTRALVGRAETISSAQLDPTDQMEVMVAVMEAVAEAGDHQKAEAMARSIPDPDQRASALMALTHYVDKDVSRRLVAYGLKTTAWLKCLVALAKHEPSAIGAIEAELQHN